jgi:hypothetical protein
MAERLRAWLAGGHECDLDLGEGSAQDLMEKIENAGDRSFRGAHRGRRGITTSSPSSPAWTNSTTQQSLAAAPAGPRSLSHYRHNARATHFERELRGCAPDQHNGEALVK